jgi:putative acyl-CoA dehydrogenase
MCLDLLRALRHDPAAADALAGELAVSRGTDPTLDRAADDLLARLRAPQPAESTARRLAEDLLRVTQAALLLRHAPAAVADAFCTSRLGRDHGAGFGSLPASAACAAIVDRAWPA